MVTFVVNTLSDDETNLNDDVLSLREAIAFAEVTLGHDTIIFDADLLDETIRLTQGALVLDDGILGITGVPNGVTIDGDIDGDGDADITIDARGVSRVFDLTSRSAALNGLTITNGDAGAGGGLRVGSGATLTLTNSTVIDNEADRGGGIQVVNGGSATIEASTLSSNFAGRGGGMSVEAGGYARVDGLLIDGNFATSGGGIANSGDLVLTNSTLFSNYSGNFYGTAGLGGGLLNSGTATVTNATITSNDNFGVGGGGIANDGGTLTLNNSIVVGNSASTDANVSGVIEGTANVIDVDVASVFETTDTGGPRLADNGGPVPPSRSLRTVTTRRLTGVTTAWHQPSTPPGPHASTF